MPGIRVYRDCKIATLQQGDIPYGFIDDGAMVVGDGQIVWVGPADALPEKYNDVDVEELGGRLVTPALIDCHTHLVFGGHRATEFDLRLNGATYEEIARNGGGILSTVNATRAASDRQLLSSALKRVDDLIADGVAVIEIKSGYGLTIEHELRMLRIAREIETRRPVIVKTTWLAAHAVPPEYANRADAYIDDVVIAGLHQAHDQGLVDAVDGFCENIGFSHAQIEKVFQAAQALDVPVKLHAEQLSDQKGALLAAKYNGQSADHLEYLSDADVAEFAKTDTVAVLLPGAFYTLRETKLPPIEMLRAHDVDMAIATDCNPGSSPISSLLTVMNMACKEFSLTPEEALAGVTRNAAKALNLQEGHGVLTQGMSASFAIWDIDYPSELSYWIGGSPLFKLISPRSHA